jgi:malic enzyme
MAMKQFILNTDVHGNVSVDIAERGLAVTTEPMINKGTAFTAVERDVLGLHGVLPSHVGTLEQQLERGYGNIARKSSALEKYIGLSELKARNSTLFFRLVYEHIEEYMPIIYTPTVGEACQQFSRIYRRAPGLWITPEDRGRIYEILGNAPFADVELIVVTDNERILGLGDQGAGGIGIPVGKLELYTVAAGIHPTKVLPISLDVGTDNSALLGDHLYAGWHHRRLRGEEYESLIDEFVDAVKRRFPNVLLQWEDFKKVNAFTMLDRYRHSILSFNDDIQGTAGVALAGILAGCRMTGMPLREQRILILGAGAAGIGIARLLRDAMRRDGVDGDALIGSIAVLDSRGLMLEGVQDSEAYKSEFRWPVRVAEQVGFNVDEFNDLLICIDTLKPTVLIGTTGQPGAFTEDAIRALAGHVQRPMVFPFSNPTSKSEACPADLLEWTDGKALIASGSPFEPVSYQDRVIKTSQGNNVYIFPGVGLGVLVSGASEVTESMFAVAAETLADMVDQEDLDSGLLFPPMTRLREVSARIAEAVANEAVERGVVKAAKSRDEICALVESRMWFPDYPKLNPV